MARGSFALVDGTWRQVGYRYESLDREMDGRRAFHLPIGTTRCDHVAGLPIRDPREGIQRILAAWTDGFDCDALRCL